jgi:hypothetical protein
VCSALIYLEAARMGTSVSITLPALFKLIKVHIPYAVRPYTRHYTDAQNVYSLYKCSKKSIEQTVLNFFNLKGIVSRDFGVLFWFHLLLHVLYNILQVQGGKDSVVS